MILNLYCIYEIISYILRNVMHKLQNPEDLKTFLFYLFIPGKLVTERPGFTGCMGSI